MATKYQESSDSRNREDASDVSLSAEDLAHVVALAQQSGFREIFTDDAPVEGVDSGLPSAEVVFEQPTEAVKELFGVAFSTVQAFAHMLEAEGEVRGLIGPREVSRLWSRHLVNSAAVLDFLPRRGSVLDIGSGAGFPGIIIAICRPDLEVVLAEPMLRRCEWLSDVVEELGLDNVHLIQARAEELRGKLKADAVTARAVANMSKLIRITTRLIAPRGKLIALKGRRAEAEVQDAALELKKHHLKARVHQVPSVMEDESTFVVTCVRA